MKAYGLLLATLAIASCDSDPESHGLGGWDAEIGAAWDGATNQSGGDSGNGLASLDGSIRQGTGGSPNGSGGNGTPGNGTPGNGTGGNGTGGSAGIDGGAKQPGRALPVGDICEAYDLHGQRVRPDMLVVLDRSSSMKTGTVNRLDPSIRGIDSITAALDSSIAFGLMVFPGSVGAGLTGMSCAPGTLEVPIQLHAASMVAGKLSGLPVVESTPTPSTLAAARGALEARGPIDGVLGPPYVVLVTDGAPNCTGGMLGGTAGRGDTAAIEASVQAIAAMAQQGIKTYVLGYDTQNDAELKSALDRMASAGGTGDTMHRAIENEASLIAAFTQITQTALSCDFVLNEAPSDPSYVLVKVNGGQINYDAANGWTLSPDRKTLSLHGVACDGVKQGTGALSIQVECEIVQGI